jgi:hypothetical protein
MNKTFDSRDVSVEEFCDDLAAATAKQLRKLHPDLREEGVAYLQDATSLYSPYVADAIARHLKVRP